MAAQAKVVPEEKFCVVCGQGSHRSDWQDVEQPACDGHSKDEISAAKKAAADKAAADAKAKAEAAAEAAANKAKIGTPAAQQAAPNAAAAKTN